MKGMSSEVSEYNYQVFSSMVCKGLAKTRKIMHKMTVTMKYDKLQKINKYDYMLRKIWLIRFSKSVTRITYRDTWSCWYWSAQICPRIRCIFSTCSPFKQISSTKTENRVHGTKYIAMIGQKRQSIPWHASTLSQ